ncbi:MAG: monovalent cation/H(+) antiporter subunit G [Rhodobacteraceae bacterium]|nr:MAG: monovalent cation/H(+) antiporter subunit G [Paracoccaceae bacterium]
MSWALDALSAVLIGAGVLGFFAGTVGLLRFPDTLSRLHAVTKTDNLAVGLIVLGLMPQVDGVGAALRLALVWLLLQASGATVGQLIAEVARRDGAPPAEPAASGRRDRGPRP